MTYVQGHRGLLYPFVTRVSQEIYSVRDLKTICAAVWLHYEVYRVLLYPILLVPPLRRQLERLGYAYKTTRADILVGALFLRRHKLLIPCVRHRIYSWPPETCGSWANMAG